MLFLQSKRLDIRSSINRHPYSKFTQGVVTKVVYSFWKRGYVGSSPTSLTNIAHVSQLAEEMVLETICCRFDSYREHH